MKDKKDKIICGIDPGKDGAIAYIYKKGKEFHLLDLYNMPKTKGEYRIRELADIIEQHKQFAATNGYELEHYLEKVHTHVKGGRKAAFGFGYGYGMLRGVLGTLEITSTPVLPKTWKQAFNITEKEQAKAKAKRAVKGINGYIKEHKNRLRSLRLDQAEAMLIAVSQYK
jgi:hypothetical protein